MSWFAVGCYYHLTGNYDSSRRYFEKATHIDNWFAPAWLGYGNAFAAQVRRLRIVALEQNIFQATAFVLYCGDRMKPLSK